MEWGTETGTGIISAPPPRDSPPQGTASPALESGFPATETAEVLRSAAPAPAARAVWSSWRARAGSRSIYVIWQYGHTP
jgi:hypothetical protein